MRAVVLVWVMWWIRGGGGGVLAPPWADARLNPCASQPRGWLMLYWPGDGKCYTIYKKGHPCPETQELSPGRAGSRGAECRCSPGWAQLSQAERCYKLFERGPCRSGEYFAPVEESFNTKGERKGICLRPRRCADDTRVFWPGDGHCYWRGSRGPCHTGAVLQLDQHGIANCTCSESSEHFWTTDGGCYEHYTRAMCERGQLFLPGGYCGCYRSLPHYHNVTDGCYELDSIGPCAKGHIFSILELSPTGLKAGCVCKPFHVKAADGACYRLYTRGPCGSDEMIAKGGKCAKVPCARGRLYLPERRRCYRPGASEPCPGGEVVVFDFEARPSVDGLSHNGVCACSRGSCERRVEAGCVSKKGGVAVDGVCHILHTQGPCPEGAWLEADGRGAKCTCLPGREPPNCDLPVVRLADYLNKAVRAKPAR